MLLLQYESPDPRLQLACDEALLDMAEEGLWGESLRFYEVDGPVVILGVANRWREQVLAAGCGSRHVPILRRASGGGAVVLARGCLCYSLVLDVRRSKALVSVRGSYRQLLSRVAEALMAQGRVVECTGLSDLAWRGRKVGGSAQRRRRRFLMHHGTLLYDFDVSLPQGLLRRPVTAPEYRAGRSHVDFLTNLPMGREAIVEAAKAAFGLAPGTGAVGLPGPVIAAVDGLVAQKYGRDEWNLRR